MSGQRETPPGKGRGRSSIIPISKDSIPQAGGKVVRFDLSHFSEEGWRLVGTFDEDPLQTLPPEARSLHERGYAVIPQDAERHPLVKWKPFQKRRPTEEEIATWSVSRAATWALVTGRAHDLVALDLDGDPGRKLVKRHGLKPNVRTRSGDFHVWLSGVPVPIKTQTAVAPGLTLKGEGGLATFYGKSRGGEYRVLRSKPTSLAELPAALRDVILAHERTERDRQAPQGVGEESPPDIASTCLTRVLAAVQEGREGYENRNHAGFGLFCQMRDNLVPKHVALAFIPTWVALVNDLIPKPGEEPYTEAAAELSVKSAYGAPARDPSITRVMTGQSSDAIPFTDIKVTPIKWLWKYRIPIGMVTLLDGDPGVGKSTIVTDIAARYSAGKPMPDGEHVDQGNVLFVGAEDRIDNTVKPRFLAAGGDPARAFEMKLPVDPKTGRVRPMMLPEDLDRLERIIRENNITMVIIDPIMAFLSETINTNNDASVRKALTPLAELVGQLEVVALLIRHLNKDSGERNAMYRGGGSIGFSGAARSVLVAKEHPDQPGAFVLARVKNNVAPPVSSLTYEIGVSAEYDVSRIEWGASCGLTANDLFVVKDGRLDAPARDEAERFLAEMLADGPMPAAEMITAAEEAGISEKTRKRAQASLGVISQRISDPDTGLTKGWHWMMPGTVVNGEIMLPQREEP